jgi:hypothetical protein
VARAEGIVSRLLALLAMLAAAPAFAIAQPADESSAPSKVQLAILELRAAPADDRPRAVPSLLAAVQRRTAVEPDVTNVPRLGPADPALFDHPLLVLSGSGALPALGDHEVDVLRSYLTSGGMLLADDRSGVADSPFAQSVKREMSRVLGGRTFQALPPDHAVFRAYYLLDKAWGRTAASPDLEAIVVGGRAAVILSADDVLGAVERDDLGEWARPVEPGGTEQREMAVRLGVNLVLYALTLDYKEDLVHLPLILERKR